MTQEKNVIGAIRPGRHLTRDGREVYIACRCNFDQRGNRTDYVWLVGDGKTTWSVDDSGRHMKNGATPFDIVSRVDAAYEAEKAQPAPEPAQRLVTLNSASRAINHVSIHNGPGRLAEATAMLVELAAGRADAQLEIDRLTELNKRLQQLVDDANKVAEIAQRRADAQPAGTKFYLVLAPNKLEGVAFTSEDDALYAATGRAKGFGVPSIGEAFREAYEDTDSFETVEVLAARAEKGGT